MRLASLAVALALGCAVGCTQSRPKPAPVPQNPPAPSEPGCLEYGDPVRTGATPKELLELSGLVASHAHPGIYWGHNDSFNALELFAIDETGAVRARFPLEGRAPTDVEDIALAPCPDGQRTCILLGDIGDNLYLRREYWLYRLPEPELDAKGPLDTEVLTFSLRGPAQNMEALITEPGTGRVFVISKHPDRLGDVYRIDWEKPGAPGVGTKIATLDDPSGKDFYVTAADVHPSGERLLFRTYQHAWELRAPGATHLEELLRRGSLVQVPAGRQPQAEAIAYVASGDGYLSGSEGPGNPLFLTKCRKPTNRP